MMKWQHFTLAQENNYSVVYLEGQWVLRCLRHRALPHCSLIKYSTASLDFVFPKKWRSLWLMDPGEAGLTLEPAQEHVEGASRQLFESATDQSKSENSSLLLWRQQEWKMPKGVIRGRWRAPSKLREWVDFQGCLEPRYPRSTRGHFPALCYYFSPMTLYY